MNSTTANAALHPQPSNNSPSATPTAITSASAAFGLISLALSVLTFYGFYLGLGIPLPAGLLEGIL